MCEREYTKVRVPVDVNCPEFPFVCLLIGRTSYSSPSRSGDLSRFELPRKSVSQVPTCSLVLSTWFAKHLGMRNPRPLFIQTSRKPIIRTAHMSNDPYTPTYCKVRVGPVPSTVVSVCAPLGYRFRLGKVHGCARTYVPTTNADTSRVIKLCMPLTLKHIHRYTHMRKLTGSQVSLTKVPASFDRIHNRSNVG